MDHKISNLILQLYQHTSLIDENDFQEWALDQVKRLIPFCAGQWAEGHIDKNKIPNVHRYFLYNQPLDKIDHYHMIHKDLGLVDKVALAIAVQPGKTLSWKDVEGSDDALWSEPLYEFHCKKYKEEHLIATAIPHYGCEFFSVISLYRSDRSKPFIDKEKKIKEIITPHLVESYRICLQSNIFSKFLSIEHKSIALVNAMGRLFLRREDFIESFNKMSEIPISDNTIHDKSVLDLIRQEYDGSIKKTRLTSRMLPSGLFLVVLHHNPFMKKLTPREIEATILSRHGKSYKEISKIMGIAENTVRSFLRNAREKFGVSKTHQIDI